MELTRRALMVASAGLAAAAAARPVRHVGADGRAWLPFTLRIAAPTGSDQSRLVHAFICDSHAQTDLIAGLACLGCAADCSGMLTSGPDAPTCSAPQRR